MLRQGILFGSLFVLFLSCDHPSPDLAGKKQISVSISPQEYFIRRIAGDRYNIAVIVPPGTGPETFDPSPADMEKVSRSMVYFFSGGLSFETQLASRFGRLSKGPRVVDLSEGLDLITETDTHQGHQHGGLDPHYWLSAREVKKVASSIHRVLSGMDPGGQKIFDANLKSFLSDLEKLDRMMQESFLDLATRKFILFHPSLSYLARDYHLEQLSLENEGKEPSTRQLARLVDQAKKENIKTVFLQTQFDQHIMQTFAGEIGGKLVPLDPLSGDWLNNMYQVVKVLKEAMNGA